MHEPRQVRKIICRVFNFARRIAKALAGPVQVHDKGRPDFLLVERRPGKEVVLEAVVSGQSAVVLHGDDHRRLPAVATDRVGHDRLPLRFRRHIEM